MPRDIDLRPYDPAFDGALMAMYRQAFGTSDPERLAAFRRIAGESNIRIALDGAAPAATVTYLPMEQWFGGRPVRSLGILGVAVEPSARSRGVGARMMREVIDEARREGFAVSSLYPATVPVYAKVGYARAGVATHLKAAPAVFAGIRGELRVERHDAADRTVLEEIKRAEARRGNGLIDRAEYVWRRRLEPRDGVADVYLFHGDDGPEGYVVMGTPKDFKHRMLDHCAPTPRSARQLAAFLAGYRSLLGETVSWIGSLESPLAQLAPEVGIAVELCHWWMLRVVDVEAALAARGYPESVAAELTFVVADPLVPENDGRFRLSVAEGVGVVERTTASAGEDALRLPVEALAPLFTGHLDPWALQGMGLLEGAPRALATAALLFAGPRSWLADHF